MAKAGAWTTSLSSDCGAASNTRRSTFTLMRQSPKPRLALALGSISTMTSVSTRASAIARRDKFTRKACGYVDDRRCRPAALPPLAEPARKAGKCSPSPTYPQVTTNNEFATDEVNGKLVEPAVASTAIGADIKTGRATP